MVVLRSRRIQLQLTLLCTSFCPLNSKARTILIELGLAGFLEKFALFLSFFLPVYTHHA
jgi:hypothetical protein